jgi:Flp pilus assembly protein TadD
MNVMLLRLSLLASVAWAAPLMAQDADESALDELDAQQPATVNIRTEAAGAAELRDAVRRMAQRPTDPVALSDAGYASLKLGDAAAALNFFTRANAVQPGNSRIVAGLAAAHVRTENPFEALRYFDDAVRLGASDRSIALDRALAFDLLGNFDRAQQDYRLARSFGVSDELVRRQAMSLSMAGKNNDADAMLVPLLQRNDPEAWRARAFMLAARGDSKEAVKITEGFLDAGAARRMEPFLRQMPRLTDAQKAAAMHFGHFPVGRIGEDSPEIKKIAAANGTAKPAPAPAGQGRLIPAGEPLGKKPKVEPKKIAKRDTKPSGNDPTPGFSTEVAQRKVEEAAKAKPVMIASAALPPPDSARAPVRIALPARALPPKPDPAPAAQPMSQPVIETAPPPEPKPVIIAPPAEVKVTTTTATAPETLPSPETKPPAETAPAPIIASTPAAISTPPEAAPTNNSPAELPPSQPAAVPVAATEAPQGPLPDGGTVMQPVRIAAAEPTAAPPPAETPPPGPKPFDLGAIVTAIEIPESEQKPSVAAVDLKAIQRAQAKADAEAAAKEKDTKSAKEKANANPARIWVQVATGAEAVLGGDYRRLARKTPDLFKGQEGWTSPWNKSSRLLVGPFANMKSATKWEADFRKSGGSGFVWQSANGVEVEKLSGK